MEILIRVHDLLRSVGIPQAYHNLKQLGQRQEKCLFIYSGIVAIDIDLYN